jgi:hypothetical protein
VEIDTPDLASVRSGHEEADPVRITRAYAFKRTAYDWGTC